MSEIELRDGRGEKKTDFPDPVKGDVRLESKKRMDSLSFNIKGGDTGGS